MEVPRNQQDHPQNQGLVPKQRNLYHWWVLCGKTRDKEKCFVKRMGNELKGRCWLNLYVTSVLSYILNFRIFWKIYLCLQSRTVSVLWKGATLLVTSVAFMRSISRWKLAQSFIILQKKNQKWVFFPGSEAKFVLC